MPNILGILFLRIDLRKLKLMNIQRLSLFDVIIDLETREECQKFFNDLLTPQELNGINKRLQILFLLYQGLTQREIAKQLKVSIGTISRANKTLMYGTGGSREIFEKLQKEKLVTSQML